jgi:trehalose/maltose hydrolase-like predicted phosphorylase
MNMINDEDGGPDALYEKHAETFANLWNIGRIETDNFDIQQNVFSSYYYLLSSAPAPIHYGKLNQFYGLSPGSLSRGGLLQDYQGHSFWDTGELRKEHII